MKPHHSSLQYAAVHPPLPWVHRCTLKTWSSIFFILRPFGVWRRTLLVSQGTWAHREDLKAFAFYSSRFYNVPWLFFSSFLSAWVHYEALNDHACPIHALKCTLLLFMHILNACKLCLSIIRYFSWSLIYDDSFNAIYKFCCIISFFKMILSLWLWFHKQVTMLQVLPQCHHLLETCCLIN